MKRLFQTVSACETGSDDVDVLYVLRYNCLRSHATTAVTHIPRYDCENTENQCSHFHFQSESRSALTKDGKTLWVSKTCLHTANNKALEEKEGSELGVCDIYRLR